MSYEAPAVRSDDVGITYQGMRTLEDLKGLHPDRFQFVIGELWSLGRFMRIAQEMVVFNA